MSSLFPNQSLFSTIYKHIELPVYITEEFDFYRYIPFDKNFYGKTVSELHAGNLRNSNFNNRYSTLFQDSKVSYWSDSMETALAEFQKYHPKEDRLVFWSYDDLSSTFPTIKVEEPLIVIDGRDYDFQTILDKHNNHIELNKKEIEFIHKIENEKPDCFAYASHAKKGGTNFLFFEKGFKKLSLRQVKLKVKRVNERTKKISIRNNTITCAITCDYSPILESYGKYFKPMAKVEMDRQYLESVEYKTRKYFQLENNPFRERKNTNE